MQSFQDALLESLHIPDICTAFFKGLTNPVIDRRIAQQEVGVGGLRAFSDETRQRHAPGALARQHPVRPVLDHRVKPVAPGLRSPLHQLVDGRQRPRADRFAVSGQPVVQFLVDGDKPLRRVAVDHRRLRAPGMRIAVFHLALGQQRSGPGQLLDDRHIGGAFLAIGQDDVLATEQRQVGAVAAVFDDIMGHRQAEFQTQLIVVIAVAGGGVHEARACVLGHMIAGQHRDVIVPFTTRPFDTVERVGQGQRAQIIGADIRKAAHHAGHVQLGGGKDAFGQRIRHKIACADGGVGILRATGDLINPVADARVERDRAVLRNGPGRGRPDHHMGTGQRAGRAVDHLEGHPDLVAGVVVVFHLGLGQRGFFHGRPHHGLGALIERAVHDEFHEFLRDDRLGVIVHRQIGVIPGAGDAQTFEFRALDVDPAFGELAAFLAEGDGVHVILVQPLGAVLFLDLPFDRQAVAIPARHIARIAPHHLLAAHHHVLQDLVQGVTDMQMPVRIGRAVMQDEGFAPLFFAQTVVDADLFPTLQPGRFAQRQARAHRKIGFGQEQGVFVVGRYFGGIRTHGVGSGHHGICWGISKAWRNSPYAFSRPLWVRAPGC